MSDIEFVSGLIVKATHEKAPEYVKAALSIKREELIAWLQSRSDEWINVEVRESRGGKWYAAVNNYKREGNQAQPAKPREPVKNCPQPDQGGFEDDDIPFE